MNKVWSKWLQVAPWLLTLLPLQIVAKELPTTSYIGLGLGLIVLMLILYRTSLRYGLYVRCCLLLFYSIVVGFITEYNQYEIYATQHAMWVVMLVYMVALTRIERTTDTTPYALKKWASIGSLLVRCLVSLPWRSAYA